MFGAVLCFALALIESILIGVAGKYTNFVYRTETAYVISDAASHSPYEEVQLSIAAKSTETRTDYLSLFNQAQEIDDMNFNRLKFTCWSLYDRGNPLFSQSWGISFKNYGFEDYKFNENLSLLVSPVHSNNKTSSGYVHEIFRFKTIFDENELSIASGCTNFFFLPQSLADELLYRQGIANPATGDYERLIGQPFEFFYVNYATGEQATLKWSVANVFVENDAYNEAAANFGPFVVCYFALPNYDGGSISLTMRKSVFSNRWYLDKVTDSFSKSDFVYSLNLRTAEGILSDDVNSQFLELLSNYSTAGLSDKAFFLISLVASLVTIVLVEIVLFLFHKPAYHLTYAVGSTLGLNFGIIVVWYVLSSPSSLTLYFQLMYLLIFVVFSAIFAYINGWYADKFRLFPNDTIRI